MQLNYILAAIFIYVVSGATPAISGESREEAIGCLAVNIYHEAKGEPLSGQIMVGVVVSNRVRSKRFPATFCGVIEQYKQFSWFWDGLSDRPRDMRAYKRAKRVAAYIYEGHKEGTLFTYGNLLYYHALYVTPYWSREMVYACRVGNHIFYQEDL